MPVSDALAGKSAKRGALRASSFWTTMWTSPTIAANLAFNRMAPSLWDQQAPAHLHHAADPPSSRGANDRDGHRRQHAGRSGAPQDEIPEPEGWAVPSVYTRARLARRWKWVVLRPCDPPPHKGERVRALAPLYLEFMPPLTPQFHWIAVKLRYSRWLVATCTGLW